MKRTRLPVDVRKDEIVKAALVEAVAVGLSHMRQDGVAKRANVAKGLITYHFNTLSQLRRAVIRLAIQRRELKIIAQALADGDTNARNCDPALKAEALASIAGA